jgi:hypothetical protein
MMSFALSFVRSPKKFDVHLCQKVPFVLACSSLGCASARKLRLGRKDAQITIMSLRREEPLTVLLFLDRNDGFTFYAIFEEESKSLPQNNPKVTWMLSLLVVFGHPFR